MRKPRGSHNKVNLAMALRATFDPVRIKFQRLRELDPHPLAVDPDLAAGLGEIDVVKISSDGVTQWARPSHYGVGGITLPPSRTG